jgi:hypothetical protein
VLTGGGDLRQAKVDVHLSVSHTCIYRIAGLYNRYLKYNREMC